MRSKVGFVDVRPCLVPSWASPHQHSLRRAFYDSLDREKLDARRRWFRDSTGEIAEALVFSAQTDIERIYTTISKCLLHCTRKRYEETV